MFGGPGELRALCRGTDWSVTPLGPVERWSPDLRLLVRTCLASPFPTNLWCGPELVLIYNDAYRRILGSKHPEALGRRGSEVWAEIWETIGPWFESIRAGGPPVYAEDSPFVVEREGEREDVWFTFSLSAVPDERGEVIAFLNIVSETTRRMRAEREMEAARGAAERAERRLREVFEHAPSFFAVLGGPDFTFELVNDAYYRVVGRRELIGKPLLEALPEVRGQGFDELLAGVRRTGKPYIGHELPALLQRTPGAPPEQCYIDAFYIPVVEVDGTVSRIIAHGADVTEPVLARQAVERLLKESEESRAALHEANARLASQAAALTESERRFRAVQDASPDASLLAQAVRDDEGSIVDFLFAYANTASQYLLMGGPEEIVGRTMREAFPESVEAGRLDVYAHIVETGQPWQKDVFYRRGTVAHGLRVTAVKVGDGVHIAAADLSERMRAEAERERLLVAAERARRDAEEANRAKSQFLATMSHELRTPLNAIGGYAELLLMGVRGDLAPGQREDVERMRRSGQHLLSLINDILNFAKLEAGQVEFHVGRTPVARLLEGLEDLVGPQVAAKRLRFDVSPGDPSLAALADGEKVRQVLLNLLINAIKFTDPGGVVSLACDADDAWVRIRVRDTGRGIAPAHLGRIFDPFVQVDRHLTAVSQQGVGLGLAISRDLARGMGGELVAASVAGEGSTFTLTLPRARDPDHRTSTSTDAPA